jgi:hypothetical protein
MGLSGPGGFANWRDPGAGALTELESERDEIPAHQQ